MLKIGLLHYKVRDDVLDVLDVQQRITSFGRFVTINITGVPLNHQELLNAVYSGPFVTLGKAEFSNSQNANIQKWCA